ncbi:ion transporter [Promicromonospora iranensis]|uniref:Voltage-gated sodium channel n=1 Tax=Promicromonospora iranensis TaxID=1105144 RepID=A0ABU2CHJ8_9MICO|nr:ion transporter [Promicromonospora iranensis]MDR7380808.1 voltage-gated sodium channel [Promicromonospora iranensis]
MSVGGGTVRERLRRLVEHRWFQRTVLGVIIANAVVLGLETAFVAGPADQVLQVIDDAMLWFFVAEILLRLVAHGLRFFRDPWNVFDLVVVGIALIPATGPMSVLRALRILRVLRLADSVPSMKRVVNGLVAAVPGMGSVGALLVLAMYVSVVIATNLYGAIAPEHFGDLGTSAFTLFQVMTGEAWPEIADDVMRQEPTAWLFFVVFILVVSFAVLNLFIAVVVSGMESIDELAEHEEQSDAEVMDELRAIRAQLVTLQAELAASRTERPEPEASPVAVAP